TGLCRHWPQRLAAFSPAARHPERANRPMDLFFVLASRYSVRVVLPAIDLGNGEGGALYRRLCDALATAIAAGELAPGARLPSERDLAEQLGVSRTTVVAAYQ